MRFGVESFPVLFQEGARPGIFAHACAGFVDTSQAHACCSNRYIIYTATLDSPSGKSVGRDSGRCIVPLCGFQYTCNVSQAFPSEVCRKADRRLYSANAGEMKTHQGDWKGELFQTRRVCRHEAQIPKKEAPFRSTVAMFAGSHAAAASQDAAFWVWVSAREGGFG